MLSVWDYIDELEQRFCVASDKEERNAIALLLQFQYTRIMTNTPNDATMITRRSKITPRETGCMHADFDYVATVIDSCKTEEHCKVAERLIRNFVSKYSNASADFNTDTAKGSLELRLQKVQIQQGIRL